MSTDNQEMPVDPAALRLYAKRVLSAPANGLILSAFLSIAALISISVMVNTNPGGYFDFIENLGFPAKDERSPEEKRKDLEQRREQFVENVEKDGVFRPLQLAISIAGGVLVIAGGVAMHLVRWRGFCQITALLAIVPLIFVPCCLGIVFGIWALLALNREEVVAAFEAG